jgi:hypothetical protein
MNMEAKERKSQRFTDAQKRDILQKRIAGVTTQELADHYGTNRQQIQSILTAQGWQKPVYVPTGHYKDKPMEKDGFYNPDFQPFLFQTYR